MNNQEIMAGYSAFHTISLERLGGAEDVAVPSMLNFLLLALIRDIPGVQT